MNNDLISRNKLIENLPQPIGEKEAKYYIKVVKAIDNALIVEERPQGEWKETGYETGALGITYRQTQCSNCGADMRKENNDGRHA